MGPPEARRQWTQRSPTRWLLILTFVANHSLSPFRGKRSQWRSETTVMQPQSFSLLEHVQELTYVSVCQPSEDESTVTFPDPNLNSDGDAELLQGALRCSASRAKSFLKIDLLCAGEQLCRSERQPQLVFHYAVSSPDQHLKGTFQLSKSCINKSYDFDELHMKKRTTKNK